MAYLHAIARTQEKKGWRPGETPEEVLEWWLNRQHARASQVDGQEALEGYE